MLTPPLVFPLKWTEIKKKKSLRAVLSFHTFLSILTKKTNGKVNIANFLNFRGVDCKFLNFGIKIEKSLKLHRLKLHFPLIFNAKHQAIHNISLKFLGHPYRTYGMRCNFTIKFISMDIIHVLNLIFAHC